MVWLLTARTICLSQIGSAATFLNLLRAGREPPLPPDSLQLWLSSQELWLSSQTLRQLTSTATAIPITCFTIQLRGRRGYGISTTTFVSVPRTGRLFLPAIV